MKNEESTHLEKATRESLSLEEAHRVLHELSVRIIDYVGDLIYVKDRNGVYLACNAASEKFIGLKESEQIGKTDFDFFDRVFAENIQENDRQILANGIEQRFEEWVTYPDGKRVLLDTLKAPFYGPEGAIAGLVGISRDITEREKAETALRESEQRFRTLAEATFEGIAITEQGRILDVNERLTKILGFERGELLGRQIADLLLPEERDRILADILRGKESQIEHEVLCKDGSRRIVEAHGKTIAQNGQQLRITAIRDVTESKRAEKTLRETEQRLRDIVEHSTNLFYMHTTDHILTYVSPQSQQFFDCEPEEAMVSWTELITDNPVNQHAIEATQRAIDTGERQPPYQVECVGKKGRKIWVEVNETPLVKNGTTVAIVGSLTDITKRKWAEEALKKLNEELENRVAERTAQLREKDHILLLQSRQAAMGEMIANIAHQWRQPLNAVGLMVQELLQMYDLGKFTRELLDKRVSSTMKIIMYMSRTIDDFRNYFKPDKEKVEFKVNEAIANLLFLIEESFKNQHIGIEFVAKDDPAIFGHRNEFVQALLNILNNARDALTERGTDDPMVTITICVEGGRSVVTISDNAGGIPEDIMDKIFDPYFTTKGPQVGTGVGLFMSKTIIEKNMGGRLTVHNIRKGAEFRIEF